MIKKIAAASVLSLFVLFANYSIAEINAPNISIELEKGKCDKCGEKNCDGKCEAKKESSTTTTTTTSEAKKGCCSHGTSKSCAGKKEEKK